MLNVTAGLLATRSWGFAVAASRSLQRLRSYHGSSSSDSGSDLAMFKMSSTPAAASQLLPSQTLLDLVSKPAGHRHPGMLLNYRSSYPKAMFSEISSLPFTSKNRELLELTACRTKLCGRHMDSGNFQVTNIDISSFLQFSKARSATYTVPDMEGDAVPEVLQQLPDKAVDAVCFFHNFHMLDTSAMLSEAHRILRCPGFLIAAWNDRDLSHPVNQDLEDLLEAFNPLYSRFLRQREPSLWNDVLTEGDLFRVHKYAAFENQLKLEDAEHLVDLMSGMTFMKDALANSEARQASFRQAVHAIVRRHIGSQQPFTLPLVTRLYILQRGCEQQLHGSCDC